MSPSEIAPLFSREVPISLTTQVSCSIVVTPVVIGTSPVDVPEVRQVSVLKSRISDDVVMFTLVLAKIYYITPALQPNVKPHPSLHC
jgi:hypothetical protein